MNTKIKGYITNLMIAFIIITSLVFFLFPFYWAIATSIKPHELLFEIPPVWVFTPTFENYILVFKDWKVLDFLKNSVIITVGSSILSVSTGTMVAYGLTRF